MEVRERGHLLCTVQYVGSSTWSAGKSTNAIYTVIQNVFGELLACFRIHLRLYIVSSLDKLLYEPK